MNTPESASFGILITRDLFFGSKVTSTANELGLRVQMVGTVDAALEAAAANQCALVLVDLALPDLVVGDLMNGLPNENRPKVVAFGSHVHTALLDEAREAGCDDVMPRSKFSATLPALLRGYLA